MINLTDLRFALRAKLSKAPAIYFAFQSLRPNRRQLLVTKNTEIVIEGYPRSANTFALAAFLLAQNRPIKIAHHLHAPAQVIRAVQWGIPTIVLIRKPEDAVLSLLIREPNLSPIRALRDYITFYREISPHRKGFVVAPFEEVISEFWKIIIKVNERFGTSFAILEPRKENTEKIFALVNEMDKKDQKKDMVTETTVARPSAIRETLKRQRQEDLCRPDVASLLKEARGIYDEVLSWK